MHPSELAHRKFNKAEFLNEHFSHLDDTAVNVIITKTILCARQHLIFVSAHAGVVVQKQSPQLHHELK